MQLSGVGADITHVELYFRALLLACRGREKALARQVKAAQSPILDRPNRVTVNLTLGSHLLQVLQKLKTATQIQGTGEVIRRLLLLADGSLEPLVQAELERLAFAYA